MCLHLGFIQSVLQLGEFVCVVKISELRGSIGDRTDISVPADFTETSVSFIVDGFHVSNMDGCARG